MDKVKMKSTVYAKRLRERQSVLKKQYESEVVSFDTRLKSWRATLKLWILRNAPAQVDAITAARVRDASHYDNAFTKFFADAPQPPKYPNRKQLDRIRGALQHIAITGQAVCYVGQDEIDKLFLDGAADE